MLERRKIKKYKYEKQHVSMGAIREWRNYIWNYIFFSYENGDIGDCRNRDRQTERKRESASKRANAGRRERESLHELTLGDGNGSPRSVCTRYPARATQVTGAVPPARDN